MKILFMGTPEFCAEPLFYLAKNGFEICGAVCRPDREQNRGMKLAIQPVKAAAQRLGIPVLQPTTLRDGSFIPNLEEAQPEAIVVVAYGNLLPPYVLDFPKYGCINLHGSLLPKYRGAAPVQRAVMNGDRLTGLTTMLLSEGLDEGDMLDKYETEIDPDETAGELFSRLALAGGPLLEKTLLKLQNGTAVRVPQNHSEATYAPKIEKEDALLDFSAPAKQVYDRYRGVSPKPGAFAIHRGKTLKIKKLSLAGEETGLPPGSVFFEDRRIFIAAGDGGALELHTAAPEGKRDTSAADLINGRGIEQGEKLNA